jgi:hypothetical protein
MSILKIYYNGTRIKKMVSRKMGRYRFTKEKVVSIRSVEGNLQTASKRKYPKCVPLAKATQMSKLRKRPLLSKEKELQPQTLGPKPTFVKTLNKKILRRTNKNIKT